ncbi:hypothetical protein DERP_003799 [Dermatophagoides pteronyssinus]|uniref:Transmembrane protein n=1 Tax=Dermatophagoides pteronyssinus TaxID=6956 RepID=A0ABQ8JLM4_DERPT|nr:hypothetical protein DERP_003799 [Dermatophagoides pteronyssinus]
MITMNWHVLDNGGPLEGNGGFCGGGGVEPFVIAFVVSTVVSVVVVASSKSDSAKSLVVRS